MNMPIELYTDGSSLGNPGPSGLGYVIRHWETAGENEMPVAKEIEGSQGFRLSTNNRMEISAGLYGLKAVMKNLEDGAFDSRIISLTSDSTYFCDAINKRWLDKWSQNNWMTSGFRGSQPQPVKNKDLWEQVIGIISKLQSMGVTLSVTHILGHNGHEFNERADKLAVAASNNAAGYIVDEVYEKDQQNRKTQFGNNNNGGGFKKPWQGNQTYR